MVKLETIETALPLNFSTGEGWVFPEFHRKTWSPSDSDECRDFIEGDPFSLSPISKDGP